MMNMLKTSLKNNFVLALRSTKLTSKALAPMGVLLVDNFPFRPISRHASTMSSQKKRKSYPNALYKKKVAVTKFQPGEYLSKSLLIPMKAASLRLPPIGYNKVKNVSFSSNLLTDVDSSDCILRERELEMLRHPAGPIKRMDTLSKDALKGYTHDKLRHEVKILDLESKPADLSFALAKDFPSADLHSLNTPPEATILMANGAPKSHLPNISTHLSKPNISTHLSKSEMFDFLDIDDNTYDLVTSCFGLQNSIYPQKNIQEIHR